MRFYLKIVATAVLASLASPSFAVEEVDESARRFITDWATTFNENDPKLLSAYYDQSEEIEVINSAGIRHHGYKAVQKFYIDDHKPVRFYNSSAIKLSTRNLGDTALVTFEHQFKVRVTDDDSSWQVHVRTTSVLHRIDGKWRIVLEHSSPIRGTERFVRIQE